MKKIIITLTCSALMSSCSQRIGDLTLISNRNIEFEKKHVEIKRDVSASNMKVRILGIPLGSPNMETAIDNCIKKQGTGEYLKNVTVTEFWYSFILFGFNGIRVNGDLMGYENQKTKDQVKQETKQIEQEQANKEKQKVSDQFAVGNMVSWVNVLQKIEKGKIIGKNDTQAVIELKNGKNKMIDYSKLSIIE